MLRTKFDEQITFLTNIRGKGIRSLITRARNIASSIYENSLLLPRALSTLALCASNLLEGIYLASRIYRAPFEKNFASEWRKREEVGKVLPRFFLGKKAACSSTFIFFQPSKRDDETWAKVAERMQELRRQFLESIFFDIEFFNYPS